MAQVRDIRLVIGTNPEFQQLAEVSFAVEFSQAEVTQNINFGLYVSLLQYDPRLINQYQHLSPNGAFEYGNHAMSQGRGQGPTLGRDHGVLWIAREVIRPNGTKTHYFQRKCTFQRPSHNGMGSAFSNYGEFTAHVNVIPEITEGRGWSNVQRLGQGQPYFGSQQNGQMNGMPQEDTLFAYADNAI